jgi:hypothetical protein
MLTGSSAPAYLPPVSPGWTIGPLRDYLFPAVDETAGGRGVPGWRFSPMRDAWTGLHMAPSQCLPGGQLVSPQRSSQVDAARAALPRCCAGRSTAYAGHGCRYGPCSTGQPAGVAGTVRQGRPGASNAAARLRSSVACSLARAACACSLAALSGKTSAMRSMVSATWSSVQAMAAATAARRCRSCAPSIRRRP